MASAERTFEVLVLGREPGGEAHLRTWCLEREDGRMMLLQRMAKRKNQPLAALDLFDHAEAHLDRRKGSGPGFLKDAIHIARHPELAQHYPSFQAAAQWNRWVRDNVPDGQPVPELFELTLQTWRALIRSRKPTLVLLKALFRWTRAEGYPVNEGWLARLPDEERAEAYHWLAHPLSELEAVEDAHAKASLQSLQRFLTYEAELRLAD
ncbi:MAG: recombination protein O N-terminal domain-containing protein [Verrucomicrobiota bacterium JB022]|nr:recombination protein O N-terminal domain-containing protein [Verrucomicrobiota bacterium JB022]